MIWSWQGSTDQRDRKNSTQSLQSSLSEAGGGRMPWIICYLHVPTQLLPLKKAQRMSFPMRRNAVGSDTMENL